MFDCINVEKYRLLNKDVITLSARGPGLLISAPGGGFIGEKNIGNSNVQQIHANFSCILKKKTIILY